MPQGQYIGLERSAAEPARFYRAGETVPAVDIDLTAYAAQRYPDLRRAMIVTVHRPFGLRAPLESILAARIRHHSTVIIRLERPEAPEASEHHAMLYAGGGWCWSQGREWGLVHLREYRGCVLTFWSRLQGPEMLRGEGNREHLLAECAPHNGAPYGYRDIAAIWAWAVTGRQDWLGALGDRAHWICSESVVELIRRHYYHAYGGDRPALEMIPQRLANWMLTNFYTPLALRIA